MIAFTYPGQGSQKPGMGETWRSHPSWELVDEASDVAERDIERLLLETDADELKQTRNAQLATYITSMVILDAVERLGLEPAMHAGHSLGEYSALTAAGTLSFADGVRLVTERGEAMQVAAEEREGTMAAVLGLDDDLGEVACSRVDGDAWVANYNAPGQVVIAGAPDALVEAGAAAKELGAKRVMAMAVSGAFHTPFMSPARDRLRKAIAEADIRDPQTPIYANVDAIGHSDGSEWGGLLGAQLCSPVRWRHTLHNMFDAGATPFLEPAPGAVLTGMARRTVPGARTISVSSPADLDNLLEAVSGTDHGGALPHDGEYLFATERLVVSPGAGVYEPDPKVGVGTIIATGARLGSVGQSDVRSPFTGEIMGLLAVAGERVTNSQPIAWLRTK